MTFPQPDFLNGVPARFEKELDEKPLTPEERLELVKKYLTPDGKGNELFAELCLKYFKPVVGRILNGNYSNSVEDVVQDATFNAVRYLSHFNGSAPFSGWLFHIGTNAAYDFLRKMKVRIQGDPLDDILRTEEDISSPSAGVKAYEAVDLFLHVLEGLSEHEKHILILSYVEGYESKEIAEMLDINENTIRTQIFRARKKAAKYAKNKGWKM
jgi:RNA polymerase sigma factor (sigma-70 family)